MWSWIGLFVLGLFVAGVGLFAVIVVAIRGKYSPVLRSFTKMQRRFMNPRALHTAGSPGDAWSVVCHVGRSTGTPYETPVGLVDTEDGLVIALPYGTSADWVSNVRAAGTATVRTDGQQHHVRDPRVVGAAEVDRYFSTRERLTHRLFGVNEFLVLPHSVADRAAASES